MINNNPQLNTIKNDILEKIRKGDVKMYSKAYHVFKILVICFVAVLLLTTTAFLISFMLFSIHASGRLFLFGFGTEGLRVFLTLFPWHLLILGLMLILILELLLRQFKFCYRNSTLYIFSGIFLLTIGSALLIDVFPLHGTLLTRAEKKQLPMIGGFYKDLRRPVVHQGIYRGTITSMEDNVFFITSYDHEGSTSTKRIVAPPFVRVNNLLKIGDTVYVAGKVIDGDIHTYGIQKITNVAKQ